jgi:serine/threonine protein phosphatase PrpC
MEENGPKAQSSPGGGSDTGGGSDPQSPLLSRLSGRPLTSSAPDAPWESAALTDVGRVRDHNEDVFLMRPDLGLFMVCDGMGGYSAGEVAAEMAAETTLDFFQECERDPEGTWPFKMDQLLGEEGSRLPVALRLANQRIRAAGAQDSKKHNMGTTAVAAFLSKDKSYIAHAGDSRAYLFRENKIWAVTADHSLLGEFIRTQSPTAEEIQAFPYKNVINRALGPAADVKVDAGPIDMRSGDVLLLCCDGLHGLVSDELMAQVLITHQDLNAACRALVDSANAAGGTDNITVVLVRRR